MRLIPWFLCLLLHFWCVEILQVSVHWFYILQLSWIHVSIIAIFLVESFPHTVSCRLQRMKVWLLVNLDFFFSFCFLGAKARTSCAILNNSGENRHTVVFLTLGENCFYPLRMILTHPSYRMLASFLYGLNDGEACSFYPYFLESFYHNKRCCILSDAYSSSIQRIIWFLSFLLLMTCIPLVGLWILSQPHSPGINTTESCWILLLTYCWICFASFCWKFLHPCSSEILVCNSPF